MKKIEISDHFLSAWLFVCSSLILLACAMTNRATVVSLEDEQKWRSQPWQVRGFTYPIDGRPTVFLWDPLERCFELSPVDSVTEEMSSQIVLLLQTDADGGDYQSLSIQTDSINCIIDPQASVPTLQIQVQSVDYQLLRLYIFTFSDETLCSFFITFLPDALRQKTVKIYRTVAPSLYWQISVNV